MHKIFHIFKRSSESGIISILANRGQFSFVRGAFYKVILRYMTQQKAFTPQVTCSTIASNKRGYAVTTNCY